MGVVWSSDSVHSTLTMHINETVSVYYQNSSGEHHRYRSWEHCYTYFSQVRKREIPLDRDRAAIELGFYLASWGMYRGSSFLLQYSYTIHRPLIDLIFEPRFDPLWSTDFGSASTDSKLTPLLLELVEGIREAYRPFAIANGSAPPTDTLVTKIILGTIGSLPACDRFFINGFKIEEHQFSRVNESFINRLLKFCQTHQHELLHQQERIMEIGGIRYPIMKLVDMHFWQIGYENSDLEFKIESGIPLPLD